MPSNSPFRYKEQGQEGVTQVEGVVPGDQFCGDSGKTLPNSAKTRHGNCAFGETQGDRETKVTRPPTSVITPKHRQNARNQTVFLALGRISLTDFVDGPWKSGGQLQQDAMD